MSDENNTIVEIEIKIDGHPLSIQAPKKELNALNQSVALLNNAMLELTQYQHLINFEKRLILASLNIIRNLQSSPRSNNSEISEKITNKADNSRTLSDEKLLIEKNVLAIRLATTLIELDTYKTKISVQNSQQAQIDNKSDLTLNADEENSKIVHMIERCRSIMK